MIDTITTIGLSPSRSFLVLDAKIDGKMEKICVTDSDLSWRIKKKFNLDREDYKNFLKKVVIHADTLELSKGEISEKYIVSPDEEITKVYANGLDSLKKRYFNEKGVQKESPIENTNYLATILFENCIISWIDDYTGYMVIKESH